MEATGHSSTGIFSSWAKDLHAQEVALNPGIQQGLCSMELFRGDPSTEFFEDWLSSPSRPLVIGPRSIPRQHQRSSTKDHELSNPLGQKGSTRIPRRRASAWRTAVRVSAVTGAAIIVEVPNADFFNRREGQRTEPAQPPDRPRRVPA
jgi:hypothetical protein